MEEKAIGNTESKFNLTWIWKYKKLIQNESITVILNQFEILLLKLYTSNFCWLNQHVNLSISKNTWFDACRWLVSMLIDRHASSARFEAERFSELEVVIVAHRYHEHRVACIRLVHMRAVSCRQVAVCHRAMRRLVTALLFPALQKMLPGMITWTNNVASVCEINKIGHFKKLKFVTLV